jgi:hypothetical protein
MRAGARSENQCPPIPIPLICCKLRRTLRSFVTVTAPTYLKPSLRNHASVAETKQPTIHLFNLDTEAADDLTPFSPLMLPATRVAGYVVDINLSELQETGYGW